MSAPWRADEDPEPTLEGADAQARRPRAGAVLVPGQIRYQLLLLDRSPLGTFISLVIPLMLLVALDLVTPEMTLQSLGGVRVVQFLTPAMASFAVLNAGFVDVLVGTTVAREQGVLTRLESTPLPTWAYFAGRLVAAHGGVGRSHPLRSSDPRPRTSECRSASWVQGRSSA